MRMGKCFAVASVAVVLLGGLSLYRAADDKPAHDIEEIMGMAHQKPKGGKVSLFEKVAKGESSQQDKEKLLQLYKELSQNKPPKGSADDWKKRTDAMVSAAQEVVEGKEGAAMHLKKAVVCKACHDLHREEE
jgi:hypothetical protein